MRVIAGDARGRPLKAPRGLRTRPTSDLLRGTIFSMLASMGVSLGRVLDLYAGSGALGIEALSRGAVTADFVERDAAACAVIRDNLMNVGVAKDAHIYHLPVERSLACLSDRYDLIFLDPPYADTGVGRFLDSLGVRPLIDRSTTLVYEHDRRNTPPERIGVLSRIKTRRHGDSCVSIYGALECVATAGPESES